MAGVTLHTVSAVAVMMVGFAFTIDGLIMSTDPKQRRLAFSHICGGLAVVLFASHNF